MVLSWGKNVKPLSLLKELFKYYLIMLIIIIITFIHSLFTIIVMISIKGVSHLSLLKLFFPRKSSVFRTSTNSELLKNHSYLTCVFFSRLVSSKFSEALEWKFPRGFHSYGIHQISMAGFSSLLCPLDLLHVHIVGKYSYYSGLSTRFPTS